MPLISSTSRTPTCFARYDRPQTHWDHTAEIKQTYGYRDFHDPTEVFRLLRWLYTRAWLSSERPSVLFDHTTARLVERKVLLPGVTVMERLVARVRERAAARLWRLLAQVPGDTHKASLEALLRAPPEARSSPLDQLRRAPVRVSGPALVEALQRLEAIRALGVGDLPLDHIPPNRLRALARHGAAARAQAIARMAPERRVATLLAFARVFEIIAMDDAIDLLDFLISQLIHEARNEGEKQRLRTLRDLDAAALQLWNAMGVLLDETVAAAAVRTQTYARIPRQRLLETGAQVETLAQPADGRYYPELVDRYRRVRRFMPGRLRSSSRSSGTKPLWLACKSSRKTHDIQASAAASAATQNGAIGPDKQAFAARHAATRFTQTSMQHVISLPEGHVPPACPA